MTNKQPLIAENTRDQSGFYLIFDEMAKVSAQDKILAQEIDEIEQLSRMVEDVTDDDEPRFMTST